MTRDEEVLRRALHSAADSIEPAQDGLTRIRERVTERRRAFGWLLASGTGLAGSALPRLHDAGGRLAELLRGVLQPLLDWFADDGPRHARHKPIWRRPAVAISAVVFVAAAAGIAASGLPSEIAQNSTSTSATQAGGAVSGHGGSGVNGSGQPYGSAAAGRHGRRGTATPSSSCSPSASRAKSSSSPNGPSPSTTPSPSPSSAPSPTPTPSLTPSPTPSPTDSSTGGSVSNLQGTLPGSPDQPGGSPPAGTQAVGAARLGGSGSADRTPPSPAPSPSCSPS
jgi:hypothetical protein